MRIKTELIQDITEQKRFLIPLLKRKELILKDLKIVGKEIKRHNNTILYLADELARLKETNKNGKFKRLCRN